MPQTNVRIDVAVSLVFLFGSKGIFGFLSYFLSANSYFINHMDVANPDITTY